MIQRLKLIIKEIFRGAFVSLAVVLAVVLSVFAVGLYRIIGGNLEQYIRTRFASSIPPDIIKVSARPPRSLFLFELKEPEKTGIDDAALGKMRRMGGVVEIYPVAALGIPLEAKVTWLGFSYQSDVLAFGVPYDLVSRDIVKDRYRQLWKNPLKETPIPVVVPRNILRSYNDGMAAPNGLPRISEKGAAGLGFSLVLGKSSLKSLRGFTQSDAVIAGFTDQVDSLSLILPLKLVLFYNKKYDRGFRGQYQYVYVRVRDHPSLIRVSSLTRKMGFAVEAGSTVSRQILRLAQTVSLIVKSLEAIITVIAVIAVSFAAAIATFSRIEYYRTLRVIGCSRLFLTGMVFIKYAVLGFAGALVATELLHYAARQFAENFHLTGVILSGSITPEAYRSAVLFGSLIPVLSSLPALLYFKDLSRDS